MITQNEDMTRIARALRILLDYILDGKAEDVQHMQMKEEKDREAN